MAHSTIHTDTAKESTLLALTEYECISARACERRGTEWARGGARVRLVKRKPTGENCPSASRSEVIIGGARPRMRRGAALALALALLATAAWTPTGAAREKTPNLDPTAGHRLRGGAPLFDTDDDPSTIAPGPGEIGPTAPAPATTRLRRGGPRAARAARAAAAELPQRTRPAGGTQQRRRLPGEDDVTGSGAHASAPALVQGNGG